jgi:hypothetical protein
MLAPLLAILIMPLAGCISSAPIEWGEGNGNFSAELMEKPTPVYIDWGEPDSNGVISGNWVEFENNRLNIIDQSSESSENFVNWDYLIDGCNSTGGFEMGEWNTITSRDTTTDENNTDRIYNRTSEQISPIRIDGWLAGSKSFSADDEDSPISITSVLINMKPTNEMGQELDIEEMKPHELSPATDIPTSLDWISPLMLEAQLGVDPGISMHSEKGWGVIGIIPTNVNVANGLIGLNEWNKPISLEGYVIIGTIGQGAAPSPENKDDNWTGAKNAKEIKTDLINLEKFSTSNCNVNNNAAVAMYFGVTSMTVNGQMISESEDYSVGSVPLLGGTMYLLFVIIGGAAGAFGAFTFSTIQIRKKANESAAILMSEKQIQAAGGVDKELKQHRKEVSKLKGSQSSSSKIEVVDDTAVKKMDIKEFDVAGTLESAPDGLAATADLGKTTGRGVIQTEEAAEMDEKLKAAMEGAMSKDEGKSSGPSSRRIGGGVTGSSTSMGSGLGNKRTMSNTATIQNEEETVESSSPPTTRRKRVVKKEIGTIPAEEEEEEPEPENEGPRYETREGPSVSDDEFSDFSF